MITIRDNTKMGSSDLGWLHSKFHFSFAEYYNPDNLHYGVLRVLNDDIVEPQSGFTTHPHKDMEIISYVIEGKLSHKDSMCSESALSRGEVQYMSAGSGVYHSEHNWEKSPLRFLQIWIFPDRKNYKPSYGEYRFKWENRLNKLMPIAAGDSSAPISVNQDIHMSALFLEAGKNFEIDILSGRQCYSVLIEGRCTLNDKTMTARDGAEIEEEKLLIKSIEPSHLLFIEMALWKKNIPDR
jgi:redox-sensitive bicupin YhaK (pirin superfamily)